jgi:hypothetical protein
MTFIVAAKGVGHADYGKPMYGYSYGDADWKKVKCLPDGSLVTVSESALDSGYATDGGSTIETMTISATPAPAAWAEGATLVGVTSGKRATVVSRMTDTYYLIKSRDGAFTDGENITDGANVYTGVAGYPALVVADHTTLVDNTKNWGTDMWEDSIVQMVISGVEYSRIVTNNYAQVLFFDTITPEMVVDNVGYKIMNQEQGQSRYEWQHDHKTIAAAGTAEVLGSMSIPPGYALVVAALPTNTGFIYLGTTKANAENASKRVIISAGQAILFYIYNSVLVWIDAAVTGEGVFYYAEKM